MEQLLKILLLEDSSIDAEIIERLLKKELKHIEFRLAKNKKEFLKALDDFVPEIILSDNSLPQFNATEALEIVHQTNINVPFILITGTVSEEYAASIIKKGADDYILKDRLTRLPAAIDAALRQRKAEKDKQLTTEKLIQSEEKYRTIFFKSPLPKWIYDIDTLKFLEVNEAATRLYDYSPEEFSRMTIKDIRLKEDVEKLLKDISEIKNESDTRQGNWRHLKKNGEVIIVETTAHSLDYNDKNARMVVVNDITDKILAEQKKEFDSNNLKALINNTKDLMWSVDKDLKLITFNDSFNSVITFMTGKPLTKGRDILSTQFTDDQVKRYTVLYERALAGESFTITDHFISPVEVWAEISFYPIRQENAVIGTACFSRDITERIKAQEKLLRMEQEKLESKIEEQKKITRVMLSVQEKERNAIGTELHDNVNQILVGTNLLLSMVRVDPAKHKDLVATSMEQLQNAIEENRKIAHVFVAPDFETESLLNQLEKLVYNMLETIGIHIDFDSERFREEALDSDRKFNIYRIAQEQCTNIVKYAKAKSVKILLVTTNDSLQMTISDDGAGMDENTKVGGIGLRNIKNRVDLFDGTMVINTAPSKGFALQISIPLTGKH
jgi:PAS domain S-box-containing protein